MSATPHLREARSEDREALLQVRLRAMHDSLSRIGRFDAVELRERFERGYQPASTRVVERAGQVLGYVVCKRFKHVLRMDQLCVDPAFQGQGLGRLLMQWVCEQADAELLPVEVSALRDAPANRFYLHHGFALVGEGEWDNDYLRVPLTTHLRAVRAWWSALQARDWVGARALLADRVHATWWTSGERFAGPDALIAVNARYPEGWTVKLLEVEHLEDGRVVSLCRVDHPPAAYFATSIFQLDDGLITSLEEYWATVQAPPEWRSPQLLPGLSRFDPQDDPRACTP